MTDTDDWPPCVVCGEPADHHDPDDIPHCLDHCAECQEDPE